jgi:hypothetical protein
MDEIESRKKLEMRLSALEFLVTRMAAELFEDAPSVTAWTNAMDAERDRAAANWLVSQPAADAETEKRRHAVMADHAKAWDDLLSSVRAHFDRLPPAAPIDD